MNRAVSCGSNPKACTAQAVSCPPGRTIEVPVPSTRPATVASSTRGGSHLGGRPTASTMGADHSRAPGAAIWVVLAMARPTAAGAPRLWASRSGSGRSRPT